MSDFLDQIQSLSPKRLALLAYELNEQLEALKQAQSEPIAIIGMGCRFPGGVVDPESYWELLHSGRDPITEVPRDRWDVDAFFDPDPSVAGKTYTRRGGFLDGVDRFDPEFFGISPRETMAMDPQQRLLLEVSWEALERSGYAPATLQNSPTGVYVAIGIADYVNLQARSHHLAGIDGYTGSGSGFCFAAGRLSYALGLQGPSFALDAACSSSLIALHLACQSLRSRECERALVGGVNLILSPESNITFSATQMISARGRCQTFDAQADGFVRSEGCAVLVLKRLSDAQRDRDNIVALIKGTATNHGGAGAGLTVPSGSAQQLVAREALRQAGVVPADIQYVEAHGTGTPLGDPIEVRALGQVYSEGREPQNPLLLASVKTNIGHTEVVSGLASVLKVVLAQQKQTLPPHLHFQTLNPEIDLGAIPAKILTQLTPWQPSSKPRLAAVNSFGMSGTNAHAILAETPPLPTRPATQDRPLHLLPLSGKTPQALRELVQRYQQYFVAHPDVDLGDLCFTAGVGRSHFGHRWAITAGTVAQMQAAIDEYLQVTPERSEVETAVEDNNGQTPPSLLFATVAPAADLREIGRELQRTQPTVRAAIARCNDCLEALSQPSINLDAATDRSPVALFAIQVALVELWRSWGIEPAGVLMLPGGEWLASWIVGAVSLERALQQTIAGAPVISDADLQTPTLPLYCGQTAQRLDSQQTLKRLSSEAFSSAAPPALKVPDGLGKQLVLVANGGLPTGLTAAAEAPWLASVKPDAPIWQTLLESLAALYQQGLAVDWSGFDRDYPRQRLPLPTYPFQRQRYWSVAATRGAQLQPPSGAETATTEVLPELPSLQNLQALEPAARSLRLETYLTERLARALGVEPSRITPQTPLQSLAVDSIVALELKFDLEKALGSAVELAMFLSSPTVAALAAQIIDGLATSTPVDLPLLQANPEARHQPFPLNEIQRAYWLGRSEAFELGNVAAHVYAEYASAGLDCDRLQTAFQHLIDRHDVLRTIVLPNGQQQVLTDISPYEIQVIDLTSLPPQEREVQLVACREELSHEVRDPEVWPLFTVQVVRLGAEEQRVLLSIDNLLVDGSSLSLLCQEWGELYQDLDATLPSLEVTFRDYVLALQSLETSALYARSRTYWQERLPALPAGPDLPLAVSPATLTRPRFQRLTARLPAPAWQQLQQQATQHGLTPSGILLAAFSEVLASWSKSRHFCLNLTTFNRLPLHPQVRELVGDFTNLTLLAVDYRNADKFARRAQQVQQQLWQDLEHSYISGVTVLRDAMLTGDNRQPQLMPVVFTSLLANARSQAPAAFGTDWLGQLVAGVAQTPQVWLDHQVYEDDGDLVYNWDTVIGLFPEGMVEAMFAAYGQLIETLAAPEAWQQEHPLPLPEPHQALQRQINQTQAPVSEALLQFSLAAWAQQQPQHPAVIATDRTLTYDDLHRRSNQVGHYLQNCGVRPNQLVAVSLPKGWEQVVAVYGILAAGAAYVPLDPELPAERRDRLLEQSGAQWVLSVGQIRDALTWPTQVSVLALDDPELETTNDAPLKPQQKPTDLAYIIYTSGSTGNPKGVAIDHRGAMNTILDINHRFGVGPQDRVFALSALSFDLSVYDIFGAIDAGGTIVMPPPQAAKDPAIWTTLLETHQVTIWNGVPALMQMLVTHIGDRRVPAKSSLRLVMMSGDWIPLTLPPQIQALWPQAQTVSLGGATEASIWSIFYPIEQVPPHWKSIPYGRPLTNQQFYVFDAQLQPCPVWVPGQLFIGGLGLAQGYWHDPEKTAASFITHPTTGERLYRTGDLGRYLPSGDIEFLGREDNQLQLRGYRIELGEIEAALEQHPEVRQAAVTIVGEADRGQQLGALVAPMAEAKPESDVFPLASLEGAEAFWNTLVEAGLVHAHSSGEPLDLPRFQGFWQYLQDLYHQGVGVALQQLGIFAAEGEALTVAQLRQRGQIHPRYQPWLQRACQQLVQQGWCQQQGLGFALARLLPTALDPQLIERVRAEAAVAMDLSPASTALLIKTVENLADLLTEQQHSAELYVAQEIPEVYQKQFESCNVLMAQAIANLVQLRQPESLRILEVGAGLGSTTKHILPLLPATGIEYHFTDISQYFLQRARQQFGDYEFLTTSLLNLEQAPTAQGFSRHDFDVVVASSVLHATRDISETLTHLRQLLRPGGILVLLEETKFHPAFDLTMGLQQGFDRMEDLELRPHHPLLSQQQWQQALQENGFPQVRILPQSGTLADWLGFDVFLAQGPTTVRGFQPEVLREFLAQKLPSYMMPTNFLPLETLPLSSNGKVDRRALQTLWPKIAETAARTIVAPRNALEVALADIWSEVLSLSDLSVEDNFFERGGDSLMATQVMARVRDTFGVEVSLRALFEEPTVAALALAVAAGLAAQIDADMLAEAEAAPNSEREEFSEREQA